ncbi:MAG TPA: S8 family serine peptidase [Blastocatellia bacterium]|nr:S8 family serine peptidase [Blastocatellia bacterium]
MKAFWLKSSLVTVLLLLVAVVGALPTRSDSGQQKPKLVVEQPSQKRGAATATPLAYRSPGARHKLVIPNADRELQQALQDAHVIAKARRFNAYSVVEVSSETLDRLAPQALERAQLRDDLNLVMLKRGQIDTTGQEPVVADDLRQTAGAAHALRLVQLFGPPTPEALAAVRSTGVRVVGYVPNNAYLVWGSTAQINRLGALRQRGDVVQWDGPYHPAYKIDPHIKLDSIAQTGMTVTVLDTPEAEATVARIKSASRAVLMPEYRTEGKLHVKVLTEALNVKAWAQLPDVLGIEPWSEPHPMDERANQIAAGQLTNETVNNVFFSRPSAPGYLAFLNSLGFTSDFNFAIDISDTGFDIGSDDPAKMHADFTDAAGLSRIAYLADFSGDAHTATTHDPEGHGTINASIAAGFNNKAGTAYNDASGYSYGLGAAPFARLGISKVFKDNGSFGQFSYGDLLANAYRSGARISSNSWGACNLDNGFCNLYSDDCATYDYLVRDTDPLQDGNQGMVILFAAGNDGDNGDKAASVAIPGSAKNTIAVGLSENVRGSASERDGCGLSQVSADNAQDVVFFSGFGPIQDGRAKPDLVAPGSHITGAASQDPIYDAANPNNLGVCDKYYPTGQKLYTWSSGTSHSTPLVAGAAALAFQWLRGQLSHDPSPAMVKALLLNSTSYLGGNFGNDSLPGPHQGWGLLNIGRMFEATDRVLYDQSPDRTFTQSGGAPFEITGVISDPTKEFRVMLAYTDAPGAEFSNAPFVNQLNLEVVIGGVVYQANNFNGQYSQAGGTVDFLNNTQGVRLPAGTTGPFVIRVKPTLIAGDGVPNSGGALDQDFALVVSNGHEAGVPVLAIDNTGDVSAGVSVKHSNNATDAALIPGEQAQITVTIANQSATTAADVTGASLSLTVGNQTVNAALAGDAIGMIAPGASKSSSAPFALQIPSALRCSSVAQLQLEVNTGAGKYKLPVRIRAGRASGTATTILDDDVDGGNVKWKMKKGFETTTRFAHSGTMSYHVVDPGKSENDALNALLFTKKSFNIPSNLGSVRLSFYHIFNFEPGFDGGILELSSDNGETWIDLGSRMLVGGYDGKVTSASSNPLGSRFAWTARGKAGVFSQVIVNLDDFVGQRIKLRFQAGFDEATGVLDGYQGWFIDDIRITATPFACGAAADVVQPADENVRQFWLRDPSGRPNRARIE